MALAPVLVTAKQRIEAAKAIEVLRMSPTQLLSEAAKEERQSLGLVPPPKWIWDLRERCCLPSCSIEKMPRQIIRARGIRAPPPSRKSPVVVYAPRMQRAAPPTIADLRAESVQGARVWCLIATASTMVS